MVKPLCLFASPLSLQTGEERYDNFKDWLVNLLSYIDVEARVAVLATIGQFGLHVTNAFSIIPE